MSWNVPFQVQETGKTIFNFTYLGSMQHLIVSILVCFSCFSKLFILFFYWNHWQIALSFSNLAMYLTKCVISISWDWKTNFILTFWACSTLLFFLWEKVLTVDMILFSYENYEFSTFSLSHFKQDLFICTSFEAYNIILLRSKKNYLVCFQKSNSSIWFIPARPISESHSFGTKKSQDLFDPTRGVIVHSTLSLAVAM